MSRFFARVQRARNAKSESPTPAVRIEARSTALDEQRARLIPILGPMGGGGAIPGTRPDAQRLRGVHRPCNTRGALGTARTSQ